MYLGRRDGGNEGRGRRGEIENSFVLICFTRTCSDVRHVLAMILIHVHVGLGKGGALKTSFKKGGYLVSKGCGLFKCAS